MNLRRKIFAAAVIGVIVLVVFIQPLYAAFEPNDIYYPKQWYLPQIGMPLAWEKTAGGPDVVVAVLDTGVDINHPDLKNNIWRNPGEIAGDRLDNDGNGYVDDTRGWDFVLNSNDPRPSADPPFSRTALHHGTLVSGIIAAEGNNIEGVAGVAWRTRIMPLRVLNRQGMGDVDDVAEAVNYAVANGADIINLSFVGEGYSQRLYNSLKSAYEAGVLLVVAAGNNDGNGNDGNLDLSPVYPVCFDADDSENWIIGVTATDPLDQRVPSANYGTKCVDIAAPGSGFFGTQVLDLRKGLSEPYGQSWSGTSLAAPVVSGVAALIMTVEPTLNNRQVLDVLLESADDISAINGNISLAMGQGRVNASRALTGAESPGVAPPPEATTAGSRIVTVAKDLRYPQLKLFSREGEEKISWSVYLNDFRGGGGVAISENARKIPEADKFGITAIVRGEQRLLVGEGKGGKGKVRMFEAIGNSVSEWYAFDVPFRGGVQVAAGDIYGVGRGSIAVVPMSGGGPQVRIFNRDGRVQSQFFAFNKKIRGGFDVAIADVNSDGLGEIIVSSTTSALPIRVFRVDGTLLYEWQPFPNYRGGLHIAAGDLDGDGEGEIIVVPAGGGGPNLRIFGGDGRLLGQFFVLRESFRGGVNLAVGDVNNDGRDEIAVTAARYGGPQVRLFNGQGRLLGQFFAYNEKYRGGIELAIMR